MTLVELSEHIGVSSDAVNNYLINALHLAPMTSTETLEDYKHRMESEGYIGEDRELKTWDIYYALLEHFSSAKEDVRTGLSGIGRGYGRYTVEELAKQENISPEVALKNLQEYVGSKMDISLDTRIRDIMDKLELEDQTVVDVMKDIDK